MALAGRFPVVSLQRTSRQPIAQACMESPEVRADRRLIQCAFSDRGLLGRLASGPGGNTAGGASVDDVKLGGGAAEESNNEQCGQVGSTVTCVSLMFCSSVCSDC